MYESTKQEEKEELLHGYILVMTLNYDAMMENL
jgi:hypothetical protein